jgi:hypothetical protein
MFRPFRPPLMAACLALATTSLAAAANLTSMNPPKTQTTAAQTAAGGGITSPGDPFIPSVDRGPRAPDRFSGYHLSCHVVIGPDGKAIFTIENVGMTTIPISAIIEMTTPYGPFSLLASPEMTPGETQVLGTWTANNYGEPGDEYDCTATVTLPEEPAVPK